MTNKIKNLNFIRFDVEKFSFIGFNGLNVDETLYLTDLINSFKTKGNKLVLLKTWSEIEQETNQVLKIQSLDRLLQDIEDFRERHFDWTKNDNLRISIIAKLKSMDVDFNQYFKELLK